MIFIIAVIVYSAQIPLKLSICPDKVNGGIKECRCYGFNTRTSDTSEKSLIQYRKYDQNGNVILSHGRDSISRTEFQYDSMGNLIEEIEFNKKGNKYSRATFIYDEFGFLIEETHYDLERISWKEFFKYDAYGKLIEDIDFWYFEGIFGKTFYKYDSNANLIGKYIYSSRDSMRWNSKKGFDYYINIPEQDLSKYLSVVLSYQNDMLGNMTEKIYSIDNNRILWAREYEYDSLERKIEEIKYGEGKVNIGKEESKYDDKGNLIEELERGYLGEIQKRRVYSYDSLGNMIEMRRFTDSSKPLTHCINIYSK